MQSVQKLLINFSQNLIMNSVKQASQKQKNQPKADLPKGVDDLKIKLSVSDECVAEVSRYLQEHGIEIVDESEFILLQKDKYAGHISVRSENGEKAVIPTDTIITVESFGHSVEITTTNGSFTTTERLYQLANTLDPLKFVRVSNSVIVSRAQIREISPTFSMKFILKMKNGTRVDVTRSYYSKFKEFLGI